MAESTKAFKISDELKTKINTTIQASGLQDKEWIESVTNLWVMQDVKIGLPNFKQDISELELHTKRINELVINMIERAAHEKEEISRQVLELSTEKNELLQKIDFMEKEIKAQLKANEEADIHHLKEKEESERLIRQMEEATWHNNLLIQEYKEKNDTLMGLVNEYKAAYEEKNSLKHEVDRLNQTLVTLKGELEHNVQAVEALKKAHKDELERMAEKKDIERERERLTLQSDYQNKIQSLSEESTEKIRMLYEKIEQLHKEYQAEIAGLRERLQGEK
ncbi:MULTISPECIES: hypothetical protein [Desulfitobacterium]|uniref:Uncharacterized protein n=1 Tax=Desulfitobacterium chlororespirans DSM 11544 TaxID=1121395 RepID=A0A1M7UTQ9_9FIRM|nr:MULTISPECIES: hypothetical protein [Desulfitobacterium]SHN86383.1 hypothetical protein SAMN02745215_04613 [Desulfitobacterium chlororespirans DSM 11544]